MLSLLNISYPWRMRNMQQLEQMLDEWLVKKAPFQIPEAGRKAIVQFTPWLTLLGGIFMLWGAWMAYQLLTFANSLLGGLSAVYGSAYGYAAASPLLWASV